MKEKGINSQDKQPLWGILGGMGPLASAEFLSTIYRLSLEQIRKAPDGKEQDMPRVILVSDPKVPDRTDAIEKLRNMRPQQYEEVKIRLKQLLEALWAMQVDRIVIPCITAHYFLPYLDLPAPIESRICSLISIVRDALRAHHGKYILLRTNGTKEARIFENHPGWSEVSDRIKPIENHDQETIHRQYLYKMKKENVGPEDLVVLQHMMQKYDVDGFVAGCTEVHLQAKALNERKIHIIDPLTIIAQEIAHYSRSDSDESLVFEDCQL